GTRRLERKGEAGARLDAPPPELEAGLRRRVRRRRGAGARIGAVAYDEVLADRIRSLLEGEPNLTEKKMFGGLGFMIGGNMAVAASGQGGVLVRVDPEQSDLLVASTNARPMEMRGRSMRGWLRVDTDDVRTKAELAKWVERGSAYARSLPPKP